MRAVAEDPKLAQLFGINAALVYLGVFVFECAAVALGAGLVAPRTPILTSMGFDEVILTFVIVVLGGIGSVGGSLLAGLGLGLFTALLRRAGVAGLHHGGGVRPAAGAARRAAAGPAPPDDRRTHDDGFADAPRRSILCWPLAYFVPAGLLGGALGRLRTPARSIAIFAVMAYGADLILSYLGEVSLGHTIFWAAGGYAAAMLSVNAGWNGWETAAAAIVVVAGPRRCCSAS